VSDCTPHSRTAAFFDLDGTLTKSNIVHYYVYFALKDRSIAGRILWMTTFLPKVIYYFIVDRISRGYFNKVFYRNYKDMDEEKTCQDAAALLNDFLKPRLFTDGVAEIKTHKDAGRLTVLVTGSLDIIAEPVKDHLGVDWSLAVSLEEQDGKFTGELTASPLSGEEKARAVVAFAETHGIDLSKSYAYGDSSADIPMLRCVGHPVVVNPKGKLRRIAEQEGWEMRFWRLT
jgi:HAD superfamily hydrolase (TIGR01490 family)